MKLNNTLLIVLLINSHVYSLVSNKQDISVSTKTCKVNNYHLPWGEDEYSNMRFLAILSIIIILSIILLIKLLAYFIRLSFSYFISFSFKKLLEETFLIVFIISLVSVAYLITAIDNIKVNWQYLLQGLFNFIFSCF